MKQTALNVDEKTRALGACGVLAGVPSEELGLLAEMMHTEHFDAGEILFEHGDASDRIYVVVAGTLAVLLPGAREVVRTLGPGELLGEYGMFTGLVRTATVRADTESVVLSLDYRRFGAFLLQHPRSTLALLATAVERLSESERRGRT